MAAGRLDAALAAWATAAQALREPPPFDVDLPHFSDACQESFTTWRQIAAHRAPVPPMPRYALAHLDDLAALEGRLAELAVGYRGLMHFDLRLDNVLISDDGAAWLCDWNWLCHGPAWFDTARRCWSRRTRAGSTRTCCSPRTQTAQGAPADALDASLAALCGFLVQPSRPQPPKALRAERGTSGGAGGWRWPGWAERAWAGRPEGAGFGPALPRPW